MLPDHLDELPLCSTMAYALATLLSRL
jgi:hypothetical protein